MYRYLLIAILLVPIGAGAADVSLSGRVSVKDQNKSIDVVFSSREKAAIQDYYRTTVVREQTVEASGGKQGKKTPPGHAKRDGQMPPGLAKRKGNLPPGLAKRDRLPDDLAYEILPRELEARLPPLPSPDYVRVRVGSDFAIMERKTRVVLDLALGLAK